VDGSAVHAVIRGVGYIVPVLALVERVDGEPSTLP